MNYAFTRTQAPLVAQLDADMIPHKNFLRVLVADILKDDRAAFVYCPQHFYNTGKSDLFDDHQILTYLYTHPITDALGLGQNGGSGVLWRRAALTEIGGFRTESLGEDYLTSQDALARGWHTIYNRTPLQYGLMPWTFDGWLSQHRRWSIASFEQLYLMFFPILESPHLTTIQKFVLLSNMTNRVVGIFQNTIAAFFTAYITIGLVTGTINDNIYFRYLFCLGYASSVFTLYVAPYVLVSDTKTPWALICRATMTTFLETPYNTWWLIRYVAGQGGAWTTTGSLKKSDKHVFGYYLRHLKYVSFHLVVGWGVPFVAALLLNLGYVAPSSCLSSSLFLRVIRRLMLVSTTTPIIYVFLPVWYFTNGMGRKEDRQSMLPRDETNLPSLDPAYIWPRSNAVVFSLMALPLLVVLTSLVIALKAAIEYPVGC